MAMAERVLSTTHPSNLLISPRVPSARLLSPRGRRAGRIVSAQRVRAVTSLRLIRTETQVIAETSAPVSAFHVAVEGTGFTKHVDDDRDTLAPTDRRVVVALRRADRIGGGPKDGTLRVSYRRGRGRPPMNGPLGSVAQS